MILLTSIQCLREGHWGWTYADKLMGDGTSFPVCSFIVNRSPSRRSACELSVLTHLGTMSFWGYTRLYPLHLHSQRGGHCFPRYVIWEARHFVAVGLPAWKVYSFHYSVAIRSSSHTVRGSDDCPPLPSRPLVLRGSRTRTHSS